MQDVCRLLLALADGALGGGCKVSLREREPRPLSLIGPLSLLHRHSGLRPMWPAAWAT